MSIFQNVKMTNGVDYIGEGEVLDVLNTPHPGIVNVELDKAEMLITEENYNKNPFYLPSS